MENNTAKHFVLQLGSVVSLYISLGFLLALFFGLVNILFPDSTESVWELERSQTMIRTGIALTVVFFPTYIILTRIVNQARRSQAEGSYLNITKWLIYLSLLGGGLVLLIDLVVVIYTFLNGDITERFVLKALAVLVTIGAAFYYYLKDARGYWLQREKQSVLYGVISSAVVLAVLGFGFYTIDTPSEVREFNADRAQIDDLRSIQWDIVDYITITESIPSTLEELDRNIDVRAPLERPDYEYVVTDEGFALCATFAAGTREEQFDFRFPDEKEVVVLNTDDWYYEAGYWCFDRVVQIDETS